MDHPYIWLKETNQIIKLSKEAVALKTSRYLKTTYKFNGTKSSTIIKENGSLSFLINSTMPATLSSASLYKMEIKNNKFRIIEIATGGKDGMSLKNSNLVSINYKKIDEDLYELVLSNRLAVGEYVITNGLNSYTFSITY